MRVDQFTLMTQKQITLLSPLPVDSTCRKMKDGYFKHPMYVSVHTDHISQIDIGIYDGAGQRIPFIHDAISTLNLQFRQVIFLLCKVCVCVCVCVCTRMLNEVNTLKYINRVMHQLIFFPTLHNQTI